MIFRFLVLVSLSHSILVSCVGSEPTRLFLSLFRLESKLTKTVKRITVLNVNFASLITLYTLRKKSKQIKILRFFPRKLIKYQTQIYRIVFQCKFLESDNFYFFGFRLKTSQLLFQAMPARAVNDIDIHTHVASYGYKILWFH